MEGDFEGRDLGHGGKSGQVTAEPGGRSHAGGHEVWWKRRGDESRQDQGLIRKDPEYSWGVVGGDGAGRGDAECGPRTRSDSLKVKLLHDPTEEALPVDSRSKISLLRCQAGPQATSFTESQQHRSD